MLNDKCAVTEYETPDDKLMTSGVITFEHGQRGGRGGDIWDDLFGTSAAPTAPSTLTYQAPATTGGFDAMFGSAGVASTGTGTTSDE